MSVDPPQGPFFTHECLPTPRLSCKAPHQSFRRHGERSLHSSMQDFELNSARNGEHCMCVRAINTKGDARFACWNRFKRPTADSTSWTHLGDNVNTQMIARAITKKRRMVSDQFSLPANVNMRVVKDCSTIGKSCTCCRDAFWTSFTDS